MFQLMSDLFHIGMHSMIGEGKRSFVVVDVDHDDDDHIDVQFYTKNPEFLPKLCIGLKRAVEVIEDEMKKSEEFENDTTNHA